MPRYKRKGELREATQSLVVSLTVKIDELEGTVGKLRKERDLLKSRLEEEDERE